MASVNPEDAAPAHKPPESEAERTATNAISEMDMDNNMGMDEFFGGDEQAKAAHRHEQRMTYRYAIRHYWPAMLWAIVMAAPIIMEGYETFLVPTLFAYKAFKELYGTEPPGTHVGYKKHIPPLWQSVITVAAAVGQLAGLSWAPRLVNRYGYQRSAVYRLLMAGFCLLITFSSSWVPLNSRLTFFSLGEFALGLPWGVFQGLTLPYVSEIVPLRLKVPATTMINIFWLIGQQLGSGVLRGTSEIDNNGWSVRTPMLIQYSWLVPLAAMACFAPESPLYLIRKRDDDRAT